MDKKPFTPFVFTVDTQKEAEVLSFLVTRFRKEISLFSDAIAVYYGIDVDELVHITTVLKQKLGL